jgi:MFS family permease
LFATFLFLTYYFQQILGYSAVKTGFAFLPFSVGIVAGATVASQLLPRIGPRPLIVGGLLLAAGGLLLFAQVGTAGAYLTQLLPAELMVSLGVGTAFVALSSTALIGVEPNDAGVASALVNTAQQTGGTLGVAFLNTVAAAATTGYLSAHHGGVSAAPAAAVHGYTVGFSISAGLMAGAAVLALLLLRAQRSDVSEDMALAMA